MKSVTLRHSPDDQETEFNINKRGGKSNHDVGMTSRSSAADHLFIASPEANEAAVP